MLSFGDSDGLVAISFSAEDGDDGDGEEAEEEEEGHPTARKAGQVAMPAVRLFERVCGAERTVFQETFPPSP